jgi:ribosomal protein S27E
MSAIVTCRKCNGEQRFVRNRALSTVSCATCGDVSSPMDGMLALENPTLRCGHPFSLKNAMPMYERVVEECSECNGMGKRVY